MAPVPPNVVAKNLVRVLCPQHPDAAYLTKRGWPNASKR
jgi:hypothetical protein